MANETYEMPERKPETVEGIERVWRFSDTGYAYDACQCWPEIKNGDVLLIEDREEGGELVVGLADTWPVAVTKASGHLHQAIKEAYLHDTFGLIRTFEAQELAKSLGFELASYER